MILTPRHEFAFPRCRSLFSKIDFICIYLVSLYEVNKNIWLESFHLKGILTWSRLTFEWGTSHWPTFTLTYIFVYVPGQYKLWLFAPLSTEGHFCCYAISVIVFVLKHVRLPFTIVRVFVLKHVRLPFNTVFTLPKRRTLYQQINTKPIFMHWL